MEEKFSRAPPFFQMKNCYPNFAEGSLNLQRPQKKRLAKLHKRQHP